MSPVATALGVSLEEVTRWTREGLPGCRLGDELITLATYMKDGRGRTSITPIPCLMKLEQLLAWVGSKHAVAKWLGIADRTLHHYRAGAHQLTERHAARIRLAFTGLPELRLAHPDEPAEALLERLSPSISDVERRLKSIKTAVRWLEGTRGTARAMGVPRGEVDMWLVRGIDEQNQLNRLLELARHGANRPGRSPTVACLDRAEIETAISIAGGPTALAKRVGITARSMRRYRSGARAVGAELAQAVRAVVAEHNANNVSGSSGMPFDA